MSEKIFKLKSKYSPAGDQEEAIKALDGFLNEGHKWQTLWGVTGSGKTFTMANIIEKQNKPTLVVAHNKTLAAQLAQEFKEFFPDAAVHYFVSYYDYYQPEAYVSKTDTYIEKEATINEEIDRLRHAATQSLLQRKDVIIVASVSCIYGIGDINSYIEQTFELQVGLTVEIEEILKKLVLIQYSRAGADFKPGNFQVMGDLLEIFSPSQETVYSIEFWGDEISQISRRNYLTGEVYEYLDAIKIFPAKHTVSSKEKIEAMIPQIQEELADRLDTFKLSGDVVKQERLKTKVEYDLEMMQEVGYVNGIENYSRYLDGRNPGDPAQTLMDYFGKDFLTLIDESHMTIPQIGGMYAGDRARKENLIQNGFRLPSAFDNRPLQFNEFEGKLHQVIAVSATPNTYEIRASEDKKIDFFEESLKDGKKVRRIKDELDKDNLKFKKTSTFYNFDPTTDGDWNNTGDERIVQQIIRPTGLLDPEIELKGMDFMVDDIMKNIDTVVSKNQRMLITTITKRSSEELTDYLLENGVAVKYLHSEVETLERLEILKELREGKIDVIVGVNLLREGLDLPEVSKIAIIDADKQGFLRSESALIQIIGRAARNVEGKVVMYVEQRKLENIVEDEKNSELLGQAITRVDKGKWITPEGLIISNAMKKAIDLNYYRRGIQQEHNKVNGLTPQTIFSSIKEVAVSAGTKREYSLSTEKDIKKTLARLELEMDIAAANMEYEKAAEIRDEILDIKKGRKNKKK
ncbi:DEAD/DEAH box helicase family protein [Candidatus Gracilibacteria bacterium]|nr:DEAD/DEAH box helicase family protein [Candidatus Gracilibacteria bacterium]